MRLSFASFVAGLALVHSPLVAHAQTCLGAPDFRRNHLQLAAASEFADAGTRSTASWTAGSASYFGGLGVGARSYEGISGNALLLHGRVGSQLPLGAAGGLQVCPLLTADFGLGPRNVDGAGTDLTSQAFDVGIHIGGQIGRGSQVALLPTIGIGLAYTALRSDGTGGATTTTDTFGTVSAGLGLLFSDALVIRPSVLLPVSSADDALRFGIGIAYNYGGRR